MGAHALPMPRLDAWLQVGPAPLIDHPRFGPMRASFRRESEGFTWECLDLVPTSRGLADLEFEASAWGPGSPHEQQVEMIIEDLDALTKAARPTVAAAIGQSSELEWQGARITGRAGAFRLYFWCNAERALLVTVSFEESRPTGAELHD